MAKLTLLAGVGVAAMAVSALFITKGKSMPEPDNPPAKAGSVEKATFGAGCFWCSEAVFLQLKGVKSVVSGYSGGHTKNPTYQQVCDGTTGHAEVIQVTYDPSGDHVPGTLGSVLANARPDDEEPPRQRFRNAISLRHFLSHRRSAPPGRGIQEEARRLRRVPCPDRHGNHGVQRVATPPRITIRTTSREIRTRRTAMPSSRRSLTSSRKCLPTSSKPPRRSNAENRP